MVRAIRNLSRQEQLNFLLTNRIPRNFLTRWMGWYSRIESPLLTRCSIFVWRIFADDLDLSEARRTNFRSLRECFIRELKGGVRPINRKPSVVVSPCDGIVGAFGRIDEGRVYQAKGFPYDLADLIPDKDIRDRLGNGVFVTLRLKSSMYHRFHAPMDCKISVIDYISGDTWNVNPVTLNRIENLFCKNERAVVDLITEKTGQALVLVPVAAILVASMKFNCLDFDLDLKYRGLNRLICEAEFRKGEEIGYFQHGSTIILFGNEEFDFLGSLKPGYRVKMGEALLIAK